MKMMSLFDGSGGFPLAASLCGIEPKYASEVEPYPIAVTRSRFPDMVHLGDVSKVHGWEIDPVDIVSFGSPCQDMSIAGKRAGIKHEATGDEETTRSGLFHEAARIIKEMREATNGVYPAFAVWENVTGAFSSNKGEDFRCVLQTLIQIVEPGAVMPSVPKGGWSYFDHYCGDGWSLAYRTFDAQYWGTPQRRRRIYLVLDLRGQRAGKVLFEREGVRGYFAPCRTPGEEAAADAERSVGVCDNNCLTPWDVQSRRVYYHNGKWPSIYAGEGGGHGYVFAPVILDDQGGQQITVREDGVSPTLRAEMHGHPPCVVSAGFKPGQGGAARSIGYKEEQSPTLAAEAGGNSVPGIVCKCFDARGNGDGEICSTITGDHENRITDYTTVVCIQGNCIDRNAQQNGLGVNEDKSFTLNSVDHHAVAFRMESFGEYKEDEVASALKARDYKDATDIVVIRYSVRRLTPTECCSLQGFPDGWGEIDPLDVSDSREVKLWMDVYKTYCAMIGRNLNPSIVGNPDSLKKWHDKLHTDSAEYKMWGNGIALPNALYVMQGIVEACHGD